MKSSSMSFQPTLPSWRLVLWLILILLWLHPHSVHAVAVPSERARRELSHTIFWNLPCHLQFVVWKHLREQVITQLPELARLSPPPRSNLTLDFFLRHLPYFEKLSEYSTAMARLLRKDRVVRECHDQQAYPVDVFPLPGTLLPMHAPLQGNLHAWNTFRPDVSLKCLLANHGKTLGVLHQLAAKVRPFAALPVDRGFVQPAHFSMLEESDAKWLVACNAALCLNRLESIETEIALQRDPMQDPEAPEARCAATAGLPFLRSIVASLEHQWYRLYVHSSTLPAPAQGEQAPRGALLGCAAGWELVASNLSPAARRKIDAYAQTQNQTYPCEQQPLSQPFPADSLLAEEGGSKFCPHDLDDF